MCLITLYQTTVEQVRKETFFVINLSPSLYRTAITAPPKAHPESGKTLYVYSKVLTNSITHMTISTTF